MRGPSRCSRPPAATYERRSVPVPATIAMAFDMDAHVGIARCERGNDVANDVVEVHHADRTLRERPRREQTTTDSHLAHFQVSR